MIYLIYFYHWKHRLLGYFLLLKWTGEWFVFCMFFSYGKTGDNLSSDCEQIENLPIPNSQESPFVAEMKIFCEYKGFCQMVICWFFFFFWRERESFYSRTVNLGSRNYRKLEESVSPKPHGPRSGWSVGLFQCLWGVCLFSLTFLIQTALRFGVKKPYSLKSGEKAIAVNFLFPL